MPSTAADDAWNRLTTRLQEVADLDGISGVLGWDQHVWMPPGGAGYRGRQRALLSRLRHERLADPTIGDWLATLADDPGSMADPVRAAAVRNLSRHHARVTRLPARLVEAQARAHADTFQAWRAARDTGDDDALLQGLQTVFSLAREEAACVDPDKPPYDVLIAPYDPGRGSAELTALFDRLVDGLTALLDALDQPSAAPPPLPLPVDVQRRVHRRVLVGLGFDMQRGRLDEAPHPFTMGIGPRDVRLTTRYAADDLLPGLLGTVHEAGHGMYEQGLPEDLRGTTIDSAASTGMHESQSRFWENVIGRSMPFMQWLAGLIQDEGGGRIDPVDLHASANRVRRSLIRVDADEVTYNLHIAFRYQLELALLDDRLAVMDLPDAWDDACQRTVGARPADAAQGYLQDMHWSTGLIGYFPSYTLGNLYAAAFSARMQQDLPTMWDDVAAGQLGGILGWLRDRVHRRGHLLDAPDLLAQVCGPIDPVDAFLAHLRRRHGLPEA